MRTASVVVESWKSLILPQDKVAFPLREALANIEKTADEVTAAMCPSIQSWLDVASAFTLPSSDSLSINHIRVLCASFRPLASLVSGSEVVAVLKAWWSVANGAGIASLFPEFSIPDLSGEAGGTMTVSVGRLVG